VENEFENRISWRSYLRHALEHGHPAQNFMSEHKSAAGSNALFCFGINPYQSKPNIALLKRTHHCRRLGLSLIADVSTRNLTSFSGLSEPNRRRRCRRAAPPRLRRNLKSRLRIFDSDWDSDSHFWPGPGMNLTRSPRFLNLPTAVT
jgi:hypothetical protein